MNFNNLEKVEKIIEKYNCFTCQYQHSGNDNDKSFILLPNNNNKHYLFLDNTSNCYTIFKKKYGDMTDKKYTGKFTGALDSGALDSGSNSDSGGGGEEEGILLEGYIYHDQTFLLSDILCLTDVSYTERYNSLYKIIKSDLKITGFSLGIHPILYSEKLLPVFNKCFIFKDSICSVEKVYIYSFQKENKCIPAAVGTAVPVSICDDKEKEMYITKTHTSDLYTVKDNFNIEKGILYIKSLKESLYIRDLFKSEKSCIKLNCTYNHFFSKWAPVL